MGRRTSRTVTGIVLALALAGGSAVARTPTQSDFMNAVLRVAPDDAGTGQTVAKFLGCLEHFDPGDGRGRSPVTVKPLGAGVYQASVHLRSDTVFHFEMQPDGPPDVALLNRIEYKVGNRGFAQVADVATKRRIVEKVCSKPDFILTE